MRYSVPSILLKVTWNPVQTDKNDLTSYLNFRTFLTEEQVSLFIVHLGGLIIDLSMGYLLFFDKTRPIAFLLGGSFHLMNSQLFSIGKFLFLWFLVGFFSCITTASKELILYHTIQTFNDPR